jgi:hypothetical protein
MKFFSKLKTFLCFRSSSQAAHSSGPGTSTSSNHHPGGHSGPNSVSVPTPLGTPGGKAGMSPISPLTSVEGPRSHHGPGSVGGHHGPGSVGGAFHGGANAASSHDMVIIELLTSKMFYFHLFSSLAKQ